MFMKIIILFLFSYSFLAAQDQDITNIRKVLTQQQQHWNSGKLEAFMQGYWKSDSLKFISSRGINYGWQATLDGYKKGYPTTEAMGKLTFTIISIEKLSKKSAIVIGKWHLQRTKDEPQGHFTLLWKKIAGQWVIVADHTS
jgi:ketosteroid isomerase-like protein